jgi:MFS family permease
MRGHRDLLIAFVPDYSSIGIWGAVILTVLRVFQGVGVGGEWGGSVLISMEWARGDNRDLVASWPQFGVPAGLFISTVVMAACSFWSSDEFFQQWGWRIPFLLSIILISIGLWVRLGILETPVFRRLVSEGNIERAQTWKC